MSDSAPLHRTLSSQIRPVPGPNSWPTNRPAPLQ